MEDLRTKEAERVQRLRQLNEDEFRQSQKAFMKSQNNSSVFRRKLRLMGRETGARLESLESRLNSHRERSLQAKSQIRQQMSQSLSRVSYVKEVLKARQELEEESRLREFLDRQEKTKVKIEKHRKAVSKAQSQRANKNEQRRMNHSQMQDYDEGESIMQSLMVKREQVDKKIKDLKQS